MPVCVCRVKCCNGIYFLIFIILGRAKGEHHVKRLKGASAFDLNQSGALDEQFNWQRGYGILTLGERQRPQAEAYVRNQKEHHRQQTTNDWLERTDEFDEGPPDEGLKPDVVLPIVHELELIYQVLAKDDFPF